MKRRYLLTVFALLAIVLPYVLAATDVTLETQPPSDDSDCIAIIYPDTNVGMITNGYVRVYFNTTDELHNMTFYRGSQKILMLDFDESYINKTEYGAPPPPDREYITFYKLQWYNHTSGGWDPWEADTGEIPDEYFDYRQQIIVRAMWLDDPVTPFYILEGVFTVTRGMPWVQVEWHITNLLGVAYNLEFVPCGEFYITTDQVILSSSLGYWNETVGETDVGNPWAMQHAWFTVGFTTNGSSIDNPTMENNTQIFLFDGTWERLDPLPYEAIIGASSEAFWSQNYTWGAVPVPDHCEYNYTFVIQNVDSVDSWHFAELWIPQDVTRIYFYFSTDNGTTWEEGIGYDWNLTEALVTDFQTTNGTSINATIYDLSVAGGSGLNISTTAGSDNPESYNYSSLLGVYDRVALGVSLWGDTGEDWFNSSSACFVMAQVTFSGSARYWFDYDYSNFDSEPEQGYGLLNQTDGRLYFVNAGHPTAAGWALGMNQTLRHLRVTSYPNRYLENVLFSWNETLDDGATGSFIMNVHGFPSLDTTAFSGGDADVPDVFEFGSDNPRFQIHEAFVKTTFDPLQTYVSYVSGSQRRYILSWTQTLTLTDWDSTGNYTVALVEYNRTANGWAPRTTPNWLYRRSSSPTVDTFDSENLTSIEFYLTTAPPPPRPSDRVTPTPTPEAGLPPLTEEDTTTIIIGAIIIAAAVLYLWSKR